MTNILIVIDGGVTIPLEKLTNEEFKEFINLVNKIKYGKKDKS
jgi:hypothetical protein